MFVQGPRRACARVPGGCGHAAAAGVSRAGTCRVGLSTQDCAVVALCFGCVGVVAPGSASAGLETDIQANQWLVPGGTMYIRVYIHITNNDYKAVTTVLENFCLPARFCTPKKF